MAAPFDPTDPQYLTPEQRLDDLARILAAGVTRVLALRIIPSRGDHQIPPDSSQIALDVSPQKSVHVPRS